MENKHSLITEVLKIAIVLLLVVWCFLIIQPFILVLLWSIILAVALFPVYDSIIKKMRGRSKKLGTTIFSVVLILLLLVPTYFLTNSVSRSTIDTVRKVKSNALVLPAPNQDVKEWPVIGEKLYTNWAAASKDIEKYAIEHKEVILDKGSTVLSGFKGFLGSFITFFIATIIAVVLLHNAENARKSAKAFFGKLVGDDAEEILLICRDVIRSVVKGILLVALIQAGLAFIGFKAIGLPATGVFTFLILVISIMQIPALLVMIPAIILAFSTSNTTPAIIFTIYCLLVGLSDNVLKPMLLGKGLQTPMIVILLGTIGGMLMHGIIGLFIGAVVLAVMHRLYLYWLNTSRS